MANNTKKDTPDEPEEDLSDKSFTGNVTYTINGYTFVEETKTAVHGINDTPYPGNYPY